MQAIGYIRQSARRDLETALSPDQQREEVRRLAERDGIDANDLRIIEDLGRSGGKGKERQRRGYQALLAAIEEGAVDVVYAKALSRMGRSTQELYRFADLANTHGVKIVTAKEGTLDPRTPSGRLQFGMMAVVNEFERDLRVEGALENAATRRARGERMGRAPYGEKPGESPEAVVAAFRATKSLNAAAKRLNADRIPSPLGRLWSGTGVRLIVQRHAPDLLPRRATRGVKPSSPFKLYRLLTCHCKRTLTASRDLRQANRQVVYRCHAASTIPDHGPYRLVEGDILPWIKEQAALFDPPAIPIPQADSDARAELLTKREQLGWAVADGHLTREKAQERAQAIEEALAALDEREDVIRLPELDWTMPNEVVNSALRALWYDVEIGPDMKPIRANRKVPDWWADR